MDNEQRQAQLEAILANAVDAIITIDERGTIVALNPATERMFGFAASEVLDKNVSMLMPSPDRERHDGYLSHYLKTGERKIIGIGREVTGRRKDGSTFPLHLAVSEIIVGDRRLFTGIVRDISDLKEAQRLLVDANEELEQRVIERTDELRKAQAELLSKERLATLGQVSGGIAHEIRNSLNAVKTSAYYLLNASRPTPEKTREHLTRIDRQVTMIDNVVTALSDVARMPEPQLTPQDVRQHISEVLVDIRLPESIEVHVDIPDSTPPVLADPHQLPIVLRNLVRNARDAMPKGGTLAIGSQESVGKVTIYIRDTGIGIAPEDLTRIMEPLYSTKARGMGLGLTISLSIVEKNRGQLRVISQVGIGSTFFVDLTIADTH